jgi:trk system potassium uptake protein
MNTMKKPMLSGYPLILSYLGIFGMLIGLIILFPLIVIPFYPEEVNQAIYFVIPGTSMIILGGLITFLYSKKEKARLEKHHDAILVVGIWIMAIFASALPFILTGRYNLTQAVFETSSGYSTTGLTVVDVTVTPHIFLFFRSLLQFVGGAGLVLVLTAAISDKFGMRIYSAEGHNDRLVPNLIRSGRVFITIYLAYVFIGVILYMIFGMTPFDAINHAIGAVATGGFSTQAASIGHYNSIAIEMVTIFLMIAGGTNFFVHFLLVTGKVKSALNHVEVKSFFLILFIAIPISLISLIPYYSGSFGEALRQGSFHFISALTGTGYQITPSFTNLPGAFFGLLIIGMVFGAGMGSTCGGIKQYRIALGFKSIYWSIKEQLTHKNMIRKHFINRLGNKMIVDQQDVSQNYTFILVYLIALIAGTLIFASFNDRSFQDALFEYASALGTVGLSVGITGYNAHPVILWTSTISMFLGRLEFYVVFIAFVKMTGDISKRIQLKKES